MSARFDAVVFDCDGILLDTERCWSESETALFRRYGKEFTPEAKLAMIGTSISAASLVLEELLEQPGRARELAAELTELTAEVMARDARPLPGVEALVEELAGTLPIAVASNTHRDLLTIALDTAGMLGWFDAVVAGDDVAEPKPAPDIYLRACELLGVEPHRALALEDSPSGVAAARAAGLHVVGIPSFPGVELPEAHALAEAITETSVRELLGLR